MFPSLVYTKGERVSLKNHPEFNEACLQRLIAEDPAILNLGEVSVIDRERRQDRAGRLDLLLASSDNVRRYEVELMLGATDESHIIRCIEYWDIEKKRFPKYDHVAVLIAEDVTSRFLNILSLFNGTIPLIVIQLSAMRAEGKLTLNFVRIMDVFSLRSDDLSEPPPPPADPAYWRAKASPATVATAEKALAILNGIAGHERFSLNYNRYYIGLRDGNKSTRFVYFRPHKKFSHLLVSLEDVGDWVSVLTDEDGLEAGTWRDGDLYVSLRPGQIDEFNDRMTTLLRKGFDEYGS